ncbi:MAG: histidine kinase N-terminal 7TM domain-containing protein [Chloroflexota bacterium]
MPWQHTSYILPLLFSAVIPTVLALYIGQHQHARGAISFMILLLATPEWTLGYASELGSAGLSAQIFGAKVE